jgi:hypothetical protein
VPAIPSTHASGDTLKADGHAPASAGAPATGVPVNLPPKPAGRLRLPRADLLASLFFLVCAFALFRLSVFAGWTFVGDSDRLNTVLNVRLFEALSIQQHGAVPTWSEQQFMGYGIVGLHWMLPGGPPLPQLLALLPTSQLYHALAILAALLLACAMGAAYWLLGMYTSSIAARVVGALLYGTGSYVVHKLMQIDLSFVAMVAPPLLLGLVRLTRRETMVGTYLAMVGIWASLVIFTVLQEIAYIGLLWGTYAVFRSVRLRDPWPVVVTGLAAGCGIVLGMPRVLTIAADIPFVTRTSSNIQTPAIEAFRFFGDGLLGRSQGEHGLLRGVNINTHEGVQLLSSQLAALAVIVFGLLSPRRSLRLWTVALVVVLSVGVNLYFRPFYELQPLGLRGATFPSRELRTFVVNLGLVGLPVWLLSRWLSRRVRRSSGGTAAAIAPGSEDLPFLYGFVVTGLAVILIPEARAVLYYGFARMDFLHSRISVAMTLPLAILVVVFLDRLLPAHTGRSVLRWLAAGAALGLALWGAREVVAGLVVAQLGPAVDALRPQRMLTLEVVRVLTSLLVLLAVGAVLGWRYRPTRTLLLGGLLTAWISAETLSMSDHRLNGPQVTEQSRPFANLDYLQVPPGGMRVPTDAERAALRRRLEADHYRTVLIQDREVFLALTEPHLAAFWDLRLVEGYSTGLPRRLAQLPWDEDSVASHHLDLYAAHRFTGLPWRLLAALNVKYAVIVDRSLWFNPASGGAVPPLDPTRLQIDENPHPVTPRAFFAARVAPAGDRPRFPGDTGRRPAAPDPSVEDPARLSVVEGWQAERQYSTVGAIDAIFAGDQILIRLEPHLDDRFLVLNELYHPAWQAQIDGAPATIYPTNLVMRGLLVPAGASRVELRYEPFIATAAGLRIGLFGMLLVGMVTATGVLLTRRAARTVSPAKSSTASALTSPAHARTSLQDAASATTRTASEPCSSPTCR